MYTHISNIISSFIQKCLLTLFNFILAIHITIDTFYLPNPCIFRMSCQHQQIFHHLKNLRFFNHYLPGKSHSGLVVERYNNHELQGKFADSFIFMKCQWLQIHCFYDKLPDEILTSYIMVHNNCLGHSQILLGEIIFFWYWFKGDKHISLMQLNYAGRFLLHYLVGRGYSYKN